MKMNVWAKIVIGALILNTSSAAFAADSVVLLSQAKAAAKEAQESAKRVKRIFNRLSGNSRSAAIRYLITLGDADADGVPNYLDDKICQANPGQGNNGGSGNKLDINGSYAGTFSLVEDNCGLKDYFVDAGYFYVGLNESNNSVSISGFTTACEESFSGTRAANAVTAAYSSSIICPFGTSANVSHQLEVKGITSSGFSSGSLTRQVTCPGFGTCRLVYSGSAVKLPLGNVCR